MLTGDHTSAADAPRGSQASSTPSVQTRPGLCNLVDTDELCKRQISWPALGKPIPGEGLTALGLALNLKAKVKPLVVVRGLSDPLYL